MVGFADYNQFLWGVQFFAIADWTWSFSKDHLLCSNHTKSNAGNFVTKILQVVNREEVILYMDGTQVTHHSVKLNFSKCDELASIGLLENFHRLDRCEGIKNTYADDKLFSKHSHGSIDNNGRRRSNFCGVVARVNALCCRCKKFKKI